jgi:hypothetical protein
MELKILREDLMTVRDGLSSERAFAVLRAEVYVFRAPVRSVRADGTPSQRAIELNPKRVRAFLGVSEASRRAGKTREAERRQQKGKFRCYRASA